MAMEESGGGDNIREQDREEADDSFDPAGLDVLLLRQGAKVRSLVHDLVFMHPEDKEVNIHTLREAFEAALRKASIHGFRFHDLRHTFASRLAQAGIDPYTIQKLMGHKTFATTQRYAHHYSESLKVGIRALETSRAAQDGGRISQFYHNGQKESLRNSEAVHGSI